MKVYRYDGTFELAFLRDDEAVRSDGFRGIEVVANYLDNPKVIATAQMDDVLVRKSDGSIDVIKALGELITTE